MKFYEVETEAQAELANGIHQAALTANEALIELAKQSARQQERMAAGQVIDTGWITSATEKLVKAQHELRVLVGMAGPIGLSDQMLGRAYSATEKFYFNAKESQ